MKRALYRKLLLAQAAVTVGLMAGSEDAYAAPGNDFSDIAENMISSIEALPGLLTGLAYMMGLLLGVLGVLKVKDHVENPSQTALKDGAIRMASGGALFALPIVFEAMQTTIGTTTNFVEPARLNRIDFNVR